MRPNLAALTAMLALAAGVAACSTTVSTSSAQSSATPSGVTPTGAAKSRTETIYGEITGAEALASNPVFNLTFSGPVNTTSTNPLGPQPRKGTSHTFTTGAGNLVVTLDNAGITTGGLRSATTCAAAFTTTVPFTVNGPKSTGQFAGASGSGKAVVVFSGELPKLSNGRCNQTPEALPSQQTAAATFTATVPLTVKR